MRTQEVVSSILISFTNHCQDRLATKVAGCTITWRSLRAVAILSACAATLVQPAAAAPPGPRAIINDIYSQEGVLDLPAADRHQYFSKGVVELWAKADAGTREGEMGRIDFDLASNSQGMAIASFKVKTEHADATHVTLAVSLVSRGVYIRKSPADNVVRYYFIREGDRWVIDDIRSTADGSPWTLRGLLQ